ncbi:GNAT family N-acetyltransferase [Herbaspirillum seropedicae]|uniref:GNAT family N-acetyltransferase n=1 Tax=Herbaspirillum seropedicae TaxID=964 RepID=UPI003F8D0ABB
MIKRFDQLRGRSVVLRPFLTSDITPEYVSWLNDPEVVRHSNQRFIQHTASSCLAYWESFRNTPNLFLSVRTLADDLAVGTMTAYVSVPHGTVDIGILIGRKSVWGTGVGQDAWDTLVNWLIEQQHVRKVTAGTLSSNKGMLKIMERSGMHCEAIRPKQELLEGEPMDLHYYGKYGPQTNASL